MKHEIATTIGDGHEMTVADLPDPEDGSLWDLATAAERNRRRGLHSVTALKAYAEDVGGLDSEPLEAQIGDLLADLRHLCDAVGLEFAGIAEPSYRRYLEEIGGEG